MAADVSIQLSLHLKQIWLNVNHTWSAEILDLDLIKLLNPLQYIFYTILPDMFYITLH